MGIIQTWIQRRAGLLVSVRDVAEAHAALAGGADWIDIKDPSRGSLGMANPPTMAEIVAFIADRRPVSAAIGELGEPLPDAWPTGLALVKVGLARADAHWRDALKHLLHQTQPNQAGATRRDAIHETSRRRPQPGNVGLVVTAYADYPRVDAPPVEQVLQWAIDHRPAGVLIDTAVKDGQGLFDWVGPRDLRGWVVKAKQAGLIMALAGSLGRNDVLKAAGLGPHLVAVRGAACIGGDRQSHVDHEQVRRLATDLNHAIGPGPCCQSTIQGHPVPL